MNTWSLVRYSADLPAVFAISGKRRMRVGPGEIEGALAIEPFIDPARCSPEMGLLSLRFVFRDITGRMHAHSSLLDRLALFPTPADQVRFGALDFEPTLRVSALDDSGRDFRIIVYPDHEIDGLFSHTAIQTAAALNERTISVFMELFLPKTRQAGAPGFEQLRYDIPVDRVLWMNAPLIRADEIVVGEADFVAIKPTGQSPLSLGDSPIIIE